MAGGVTGRITETAPSPVVRSASRPAFGRRNHAFYRSSFLFLWYIFPARQTHWTLAQTLQSRGVSPPALAKVSGLSKNTVYDIVNGKSQGVTLETVDRLLSGLEKLTGQRMTLDAVLARTMTHDVQDTALLAQLAGLPPFDLKALRASLPH